MAKKNNATRGGSRGSQNNGASSAVLPKGKIAVVLTGAGSFATGKIPGRIFIQGKAEQVSEKEALILLGTQLFKRVSGADDLPVTDDDPSKGRDQDDHTGGDDEGSDQDDHTGGDDEGSDDD
ncbi:MAG: hypothetical protein ACM3X6_02870 [Patescibacteria group bacterium]